MTGDKATYLVQIRQLAVLVDEDTDIVTGDDVNIGTDDREATTAWVDVALVAVAPKTKRKTALLEGLKQAKIELSEDLEARVLDDEASYIWRARPPAPKGLVLR